MTTPRTVNFEVGHRFGSEGQLEVTELLNETIEYAEGKRSRRRCKVVCHTCKGDDVLHGAATYSMSIYDVQKGNSPCGCAKNPKWSEQQWRVLAERAALSNNQSLLEIYDFAGQKTKVMLSCLTCHHEWSSSNLGAVVTKRGCPACAQRARVASRLLPHETTVAKFMATGSYLQGTVFSKVGNAGRIWQYTCPVCSVDEYVKAGVCTGVFISDRTNFMAGKLTCRCAHNHRWSTGEREFQINKIIRDTCRHYKFVGWVGGEGYKTQTSRIVVECNDHGTWDASISAFIDQLQGCPKCATSGFNKGKDGSVYILVAEGRHSFVGYGISNVPDRRLSEHARNLKRAGFTIGATQIFDMTGQQAWDLEQAIKANFQCNPQDVEGFRTEATYYENYQAVCDFVDKWLFENT